MANDYFQFKKFTIQQDKTAMKVGTDGVLLGAWCSVDNRKSLLDVGCGTGLISLMLAQRNDDAHIQAIEIDEDAAQQAYENVASTEWRNRIEIHHISFQDFVASESDKYDLIVSNPPFFTDSLKNKSTKKTLARHDETLSFSDLLTGVSAILHDDGLFCVVLPIDQKEVFTLLAKINGLYLNRILYVKPTPAKDVKRVLMEFSFYNVIHQEEEMILEEFGRHQYSDKYIELTKDFYLDK